MEYKQLEKLAFEVSDLYDALNKKDGHNTWTYREYLEGLMGDLGDLHKLLMAKRKYRHIEGDVDEKIEHELADCLWAIMLIAKGLDIDLESAFITNVSTLRDRLKVKLD